MVHHSLINAKNGEAAVAAASTAVALLTQALNTYLAKRQGQAVVDRLKPEIESQLKELQELRVLQENTVRELENAKSAIMTQQSRFDRRNLLMSFLWFALGAATPIGLKYFLGVG